MNTDNGTYSENSAEFDKNDVEFVIEDGENEELKPVVLECVENQLSDMIAVGADNILGKKSDVDVLAESFKSMGVDKKAETNVDEASIAVADDDEAETKLCLLSFKDMKIAYDNEPFIKTRMFNHYLGIGGGKTSLREYDGSVTLEEHYLKIFHDNADKNCLVEQINNNLKYSYLLIDMDIEIDIDDVDHAEKLQLRYEHIIQDFKVKLREFAKYYEEDARFLKTSAKYENAFDFELATKYKYDNGKFGIHVWFPNIILPCSDYNTEKKPIYQILKQWCDRIIRPNLEVILSKFKVKKLEVPDLKVSGWFIYGHGKNNIPYQTNRSLLSYHNLEDQYLIEDEEVLFVKRYEAKYPTADLKKCYQQIRRSLYYLNDLLQHEPNAFNNKLLLELDYSSRELVELSGITKPANININSTDITPLNHDLLALIDVYPLFCDLIAGNKDVNLEQLASIRDGRYNADVCERLIENGKKLVLQLPNKPKKMSAKYERECKKIINLRPQYKKIVNDTSDWLNYAIFLCVEYKEYYEFAFCLFALTSFGHNLPCEDSYDFVCRKHLFKSFPNDLINGFADNLVDGGFVAFAKTIFPTFKWAYNMSYKVNINFTAKADLDDILNMLEVKCFLRDPAVFATEGLKQLFHTPNPIPPQHCKVIRKPNVGNRLYVLGEDLVKMEKQNNIIIIKSNMGSGKTRSTLVLIESILAENSENMVLIITPRVSYGEEINKQVSKVLKENEIFFYLEHTNKKSWTLSENKGLRVLIFQYESIQHVKSELFQGKKLLIILDEVESILTQVCSDTNDSKIRNFKIFQTLLRRSNSKVICCDAFVSPNLTMKTFWSLVTMNEDVKIQYIHYNYNNNKFKCVVFKADTADEKSDKEAKVSTKKKKRQSFEQQLTNPLDTTSKALINFQKRLAYDLLNGKNIYMYFTSAEEEKKVMTKLIEDKIIAYEDIIRYSGSKDNDILGKECGYYERVINVDDWKKPNVRMVITTATITVGINFDVVDKFDKAYIYFNSGNDNLLRDALQSIMRVRHYKDNEIVLYLQPSVTFEPATFEKAMKKVKASVNKEQFIISFNNSCRKEDEEKKTVMSVSTNTLTVDSLKSSGSNGLRHNRFLKTSEKNPYFDILCANMVEKAVNRIKPYELLLSYAKELQYTVELVNYDDIEVVENEVKGKVNNLIDKREKSSYLLNFWTNGYGFQTLYDIINSPRFMVDIADLPLAEKFERSHQLKRAGYVQATFGRDETDKYYRFFSDKLVEKLGFVEDGHKIALYMTDITTLIGEYIIVTETDVSWEQFLLQKIHGSNKRCKYHGFLQSMWYLWVFLEREDPEKRESILNIVGLDSFKKCASLFGFYSNIYELMSMDNPVEILKIIGKEKELKKSATFIDSWNDGGITPDALRYAFCIELENKLITTDIVNNIKYVINNYKGDDRIEAVINYLNNLNPFDSKVDYSGEPWKYGVERQPIFYDETPHFKCLSEKLNSSLRVNDTFPLNNHRYFHHKNLNNKTKQPGKEFEYSIAKTFNPLLQEVIGARIHQKESERFTFYFHPITSYYLFPETGNEAELRLSAIEVDLADLIEDESIDEKQPRYSLLRPGVLINSSDT